MQRIIKITLLGLVFVIFSSFVYFLIAVKKPTEGTFPAFNERDCRTLLSQKDPLISQMDFEEQQFNYHIDFSQSLEPVNWKVNRFEKKSGETPSKIVFFVSSNFFEGCGMRLNYIITETTLGYEHFKCKNETEMWLKIRKNPYFVFAHSIIKGPKNGGEVFYYYSNFNNFGTEVIDNSYSKIINECQKL